MHIERFSPDHADAVVALFTAVFSESENPGEGALIGHLVRDLITSTAPADLLGFIALLEGKPIGGIFFSRLTLPAPRSAFLLSPVAIATAQQGKGLGQKLIRYGIDTLRAKGVDLLCTYGDPRYYNRLGFRQVSEDTIPAPLPLSQPEGWLAQSLEGDAIEPVAGPTRCVSALNKPQYW